MGLNGSGKTTLLEAIAVREVPVPGHFDIYLHQEEVSSNNNSLLTAIATVLRPYSNIGIQIVHSVSMVLSYAYLLSLVGTPGDCRNMYPLNRDSY